MDSEHRQILGEARRSRGILGADLTNEDAHACSVCAERVTSSGPVQ